MAGSQKSVYRGHEIETFASFDGLAYAASFRIRREGAPETDGMVRTCNGQAATGAMGHAMALRMARALVDLIMDDVESGSRSG